MKSRIGRAALALAMTGMLAGCGGTGEAPGDEPQTEFAPGEISDPVPVPDYVSAAIADPARAYHFGRDERRRPGELIAFSGLRPGDRVLDLIPGGGYWTRLFSLIVGPEGHVYAVWPKNYADVAVSDVRRLRELVESPPFTNITVEVQPTPDLSAPEPLDMVWTSQNYHDYPDEFMGHYDPARLNAAVFAMLRPGGTWFIVDHAAEEGSGMRDTESLHRIDAAEVRRQVEAAGFEFVGESRVLRNAGDDRTLPVFDDSVRGHTDQFVMRFRKPE
ncbi:class I SAM-dependent methyltransferase [Parasphingopyxis marina]|uniref:class I SAM-dependent methyltransferase n=1 Tax=Parasphingopyxis marina TaxID=2761622 RepID=UPI001C8D0C72|nr:methyltransferase [Parasphingopyxis marina]